MLLLNRFTLGMMFALAGLHKVSHGSFNLFESTKPDQVPMLYGYLLPFVEIIAGLALVAGFFARTASTLIVLMLLSFLIGMGIKFWPQRGDPFDSNVILFTLALWLTMAGPGAWSADASMRRRRDLARSQVAVPPMRSGPKIAEDRDRTPPPKPMPVVDSGSPIDSQPSDQPSDPV